MRGGPGSSLLRTTPVRAADTARTQDPQLAAIYYPQMTERGKDHPGALCAAAAHLAERAWTVLRRGTPHVIRDTDGRPVTTAQGGASFFPDCGSFRILTGKDGISCQGKLGTIRLSSARKPPGWWW